MWCSAFGQKSEEANGLWPQGKLVGFRVRLVIDSKVSTRPAGRDVVRALAHQSLDKLRCCVIDICWSDLATTTLCRREGLQYMAFSPLPVGILTGNTSLASHRPTDTAMTHRATLAM